MADPKVELPRSPSSMVKDEQQTNHTSGNKVFGPRSPQSPRESASSRIWDFEKYDKDFTGPEKSSQEERREEEWPIIYRYLTFETELPAPSSITPRTPDAPPPPEPPNLAKFDNPFDWKESRKTFIIWLSCVTTAFTAFTAGAYSPGAQQMSQEWHVSTVAVLVGITTFTTGFGIAPMVLAPFSEINGRRPVFIATGVLFVISQLCCAVTQSYAGILAARFFVGVGGSTFSTMVGGVVSDLYHTKDRNTPMALFSGAALIGTGLGPFICGFIAQHSTWRWMFWMQTIMDGTLMVVVIICFKETRGSVLLSRKATALNAYYAAREEAGYVGVNMPSGKEPGTKAPQRIRWKVKSDEERASISKMIGISLYRPFHLLLTEPVVFWFSLWVSFSWAVLYMTFGAIPVVFKTTYGFNVQQSGYIFSVISVAAVLFTFVTIYQDKIAVRYNKLPTTPEARLYFACVESALMPVGCFMLGWTLRPDIHWIVPTIAVGIATCGIFSIYLAVFNYLADTYHRYASSALAAQSFCRNILGGAFPLVTGALYTNLGYGQAGSLLGGIGVGLTFVPWVLLIYGVRIRARSKFASEIMHTAD
jgi:multidrug resistance protein